MLHLIMNKRQYIKRDRTYWYENRKQHYFNKLGIVFLFILAALLLGYLFGLSKKAELVSANGSETLTHTEIIMCEKGVPEYLQCLAVKGTITDKEARIMTAISKAESNHNPKAKNKVSTARGAFQILAGTWYSNDCIGDKYNFKDNTNCAVKILRGQGLHAWEVYNTGSYLKYLTK